MKSKPVELSVTTVCMYHYDIVFPHEKRDTEKDREYDRPLAVGEELTAWWCSKTYLIERIVHTGNKSIVFVKEHLPECEFIRNNR